MHGTWGRCRRRPRTSGRRSVPIRLKRSPSLRGADVLQLEELRVDVTGRAMLAHRLADVGHQLVSGAIEIETDEVRLPRLEAGAPVDLAAVPFGVVEVHRDRVPMRDRHVDLDV